MIDSCGWIEYFTGSPLSDECARCIDDEGKLKLICPTIIIYEVYKRLKMTVGEEEALKAVAFIRSLTDVVPLSETISLAAADTGISERIPMADSIVYATAMVSNSSLVTGDADLKGRKDVIHIGK